MERENFPADRRLNRAFLGPIRAFLTVGKLIRILLVGRKLTRLFSADGNLKKTHLDGWKFDKNVLRGIES